MFITLHFGLHWYNLQLKYKVSSNFPSHRYLIFFPLSPPHGSLHENCQKQIEFDFNSHQKGLAITLSNHLNLLKHFFSDVKQVILGETREGWGERDGGCRRSDIRTGGMENISTLND